MTSITNISIRFSDIDMAGHVHNSKYLCYFEQGRIDFLSQIAGKNWNWKKKGIVLGKNEVEYLKPIYLTDQIFIVILSLIQTISMCALFFFNTFPSFSVKTLWKLSKIFCPKKDVHDDKVSSAFTKLKNEMKS